MTQGNRDPLQPYPGEEEFACKGVPEAVRAGLRYTSQPEHLRQTARAITHGALGLRVTAPDEEAGAVAGVPVVAAFDFSSGGWWPSNPTRRRLGSLVRQIAELPEMRRTHEATSVEAVRCTIVGGREARAQLLVYRMKGTYHKWHK